MTSTPARITVLVNAVHAKSGGGVTYLRNLLPRLAARGDLDLQVVVQRGYEDKIAALAPGLPLHVLPARGRLATVLVQEQWDVPCLARRLGARVMFSPANYGPLWGPPAVLVLQNSFQVGVIDRRLAQRVYWLAVRLLTWLSFLRCRRAIAISAHVEGFFRRAFGCGDDRRLVTIPLGVGAPFAPPEAEGGRSRFRLLAVSDLYVQKNLETAIDALALLAPQYPQAVLDVAGRPIDADYAAALKQRCRDKGVAERVNFLGGVDPQHLAELYRSAEVFVFPSVVESFGIPVLEAMASGLPVVCARASALPEVAGDAARYAEPRDAAALAAAIAALFDDEASRRQLAARGIQRAGQFSWDHAAQATADVLLAVARGHAA